MKTRKIFFVHVGRPNFKTGLTGGIDGVLKGLKLEPNAEIEKNYGFQQALYKYLDTGGSIGYQSLLYFCKKTV